MNESRFNNSHIFSSRDLEEMDISKIQEFIRILEEHQLKCEGNGRFVEAEMARQKVLQFKKLEEEKKVMNLKKLHFDQKSKIDQEYKEELDHFNAEWDSKFADLNERYEALQKQLNEKFQKEQEENIMAFEQKYPKEPKAPVEILNLQKTLEQAVKMKDYPKAHQIQMQILELNKVDMEKYNRIKLDKLNKEILKLKEKQDLELEVFQNKMNQTFNEFKKSRALETEKIIQKYKNRTKELEKFQQKEIQSEIHPNKARNYSNSRPSSKLGGSKYLQTSNSQAKSKQVDQNYNNLNQKEI
jgi:hypothetical protein